MLQQRLLPRCHAPGQYPSDCTDKTDSCLLTQAAAADPAEAVLASSLHAATSSQPSATDSSQPCLAASLATSTAHAAAVQPQKAAWPQADLPAAVEQPTCSAGATDNHQIGTISEHNMDCVSRDDCLARSPPSTGTADPHCQHRLKPEASSPTLSASSCRLLGGSQPPTTPTSERSTSPPAPASAAPPRHDIHHQVAVLSVLAGVAVDQASSLKQSRPPDANNMSAEPQSLDEDPRTGGGDSQEARSASSSPIYRALREDMPQGEDWQVVKGSRKGGTNVVKATPDSVTHELSRAAAQHEVLSARREQPVTAHSRSQEAAREAAEEASANLNGCAPHQAKPVRPSPSQASMSSWASFDTTGTQDRYSTDFQAVILPASL